MHWGIDKHVPQGYVTTERTKSHKKITSLTRNSHHAHTKNMIILSDWQKLNSALHRWITFPLWHSMHVCNSSIPLKNEWWDRIFYTWSAFFMSRLDFDQNKLSKRILSPCVVAIRIERYLQIESSIFYEAWNIFHIKCCWHY